MSKLGPFQRAMLRAKEELGDFDEAWAEVEKRREPKLGAAKMNDLKNPSVNQPLSLYYFKRWLKKNVRSKYMPHQGKQEAERRRKRAE
jgi:hypothetical protein